MKKKIMFAEDDPSIQDAVKIILEKEGYEVVIVTDGRPILKNEYDPPDLFILDKRLSGVDGLDICKFVKSQSHTAHIPVIMLSANPNILQMAKDVCADDALEKPFRMKDLKNMVATHLGKTSTPDKK